jgi:hypothetical protein
VIQSAEAPDPHSLTLTRAEDLDVVMGHHHHLVLICVRGGHHAAEAADIPDGSTLPTRRRTGSEPLGITFPTTGPITAQLPCETVCPAAPAVIHRRVPAAGL